MSRDPEMLHRRDTWIAGIAIILFLVLWDVARTIPPLDQEVSVYLTMPSGNPQHPDPLVATGVVGDGDFLLIAYTDAQTATFFYQSWGHDPVQSPPITFKPGVRIKAKLSMPVLANAGHATPAKTGKLRLQLDELLVMEREVPFHPCDPSRIFFAENPVGGPTVGTAFRGQMTTLDGRPVLGNAGAFFSAWAQFACWLKTRWWHLFPIALFGAGAAWLGRRIFEPRSRDEPHRFGWIGTALTLHHWFLLCAAVNVLVFTWLMTGGKFRLYYPDAFGAFFDFQIQSILRGHMDVPFESLGSEAFAVNGKYYGYFGPTPAFLRLPLVLAGVGFGHMTRGFMLLHYVSSMVGAYFLLGYVFRLARGPDVRPSAWAVILTLTSVGLGSSLLFLASRAYVYHEAILCGTAFTIWSTFFSLRYLEAPKARWWLASLVCGVLAIQARPPSGLFALFLLGCVALVHLIAVGRDFRAWRQPVLVGALAGIGFASLYAMAYLKFGTPDGAPLRYHVQYNAERLAKIEGKNFHFANVHHNLDAYFLRPSFQAGLRAPFFIFDLKKREYPGAKMDLEENVVGILYSMAGLVALSLAAGVSAIREPRTRRPIGLIAIAAAPLVVVMLTFVGTSHRYTADFCAPLVAAGIFGIVYLDGLVRVWRTVLLASVSVLTAFAFLLTLGLSFHYQVDLVWGVPEELRNNFLHLRQLTDRWFPGK